MNGVSERNVLSAPWGVVSVVIGVFCIALSLYITSRAFNYGNISPPPQWYPSFIDTYGWLFISISAIFGFIAGIKGRKNSVFQNLCSAGIAINSLFVALAILSLLVP